MIAIKDMKMPPNCMKCRFLNVDYDYDVIVCKALRKSMDKKGHIERKLGKKRMYDCPLIECVGIIRGFKEHKPNFYFDEEYEVEK